MTKEVIYWNERKERKNMFWIPYTFLLPWWSWGAGVVGEWGEHRQKKRARQPDITWTYSSLEVRKCRDFWVLSPTKKHTHAYTRALSIAFSEQF